jgi:hypothetical protein
VKKGFCLGEKTESIYCINKDLVEALYFPLNLTLQITFLLIQISGDQSRTIERPANSEPNGVKRPKSMKNNKKTSHHRQDKPPAYFNIVVQGVGFEPTNAYAIGS